MAKLLVSQVWWLATNLIFSYTLSQVMISPPLEIIRFTKLYMETYGFEYVECPLLVGSSDYWPVLYLETVEQRDEDEETICLPDQDCLLEAVRQVRYRCCYCQLVTLVDKIGNSLQHSLWSYSTVLKYRKSYLRTLEKNPRDTLP